MKEDFFYIFHLQKRDFGFLPPSSDALELHTKKWYQAGLGNSISQIE